MKIQFMSDLHLEFHPSIPFEFDITGDVLVLAGDIHSGTKHCSILSDLAKEYQKIFYVLGNHEFYRNEWYDVLNKHKIYKYPNNVHFLHYEAEPVIYNGVAFIGDTMWTDISNPRSALVAKHNMNDYFLCKIKDRRLDPKDTTDAHFQAKKYISQQINNVNNTTSKAFQERNYANKIVMVTHHLPSFSSVPIQYRWEQTNPAYYTNLHDLMQNVDLWIHGHTHDSCDYTEVGCRVVCNPRGYYPYPGALNPEFDAGKFVEI